MLEPLLPRLKREIDARLAELRPVVAEAAQLEAAKRALLEDARPPRALSRTPTAPILPPLEASRTTPARRDSSARKPTPVVAERAPSADPTRDAILALIDERPGVSVAEIVAVTKLAKAYVAATVAALKRAGVLADEAGGVKLASREPVTLAQMSRT